MTSKSDRDRIDYAKFFNIVDISSKSDSKNGMKIDKDRSKIKSHPLYPVLEYLFGKCELSTSSLTRSNYRIDLDEVRKVIGPGEKSDQCKESIAPTADRGVKEWRTGDEELDELMLRAIQIVRIQLLELEKVDELCKDFCSRYTSTGGVHSSHFDPSQSSFPACLKGKVTHEMLMGWTDPCDEDSCSPPPSSMMLDDDDEDSNFPAHNHQSSSSRASTIVATMQMADGQQVSIPLTIPYLAMQQDDLSQRIAASKASTNKVDESTASSNQTAVNGNRKSLTNITTDGSGPTNRVVKPRDQTSEGGCDKAQKPDASTSNSKGKRGSLPKKAVDILRTWLFQNIRHPYPSEDEKRDLCTQSGLNLLQVNNWFINARRRILQPLLDGAPGPSSDLSTVASSISTSNISNPSNESPKSVSIDRKRTKSIDRKSSSSSSSCWLESSANRKSIREDDLDHDQSEEIDTKTRKID